MQGLVNTFEDTPAYLFCYHAGAGGNFLKILSLSYYYPDEIQEFAFSEGHAHYKLPKHIKNDYTDTWHDSTYKIVYEKCKGNLARWQLMTQMYWSSSQFANVTPLDKTKPVTMLVHGPIKFKHYKQRFPKGKVLIVSYDPTDIPVIRGNYFYKRLIVTYDNHLDSTKFYDTVKKMYNISAEHPKDASPEEMNKYFFDVPKNLEHLETLHPIDDDIYIIKFSDLMNRKEYVLEQISKMVGLPIPNKARMIYDNYIESQRKLRQEKMPWAL
jgi:hypothetical protein